MLQALQLVAQQPAHADAVGAVLIKNAVQFVILHLHWRQITGQAALNSFFSPCRAIDIGDIDPVVIILTRRLKRGLQFLGGFLRGDHADPGFNPFPAGRRQPVRQKEISHPCVGDLLQHLEG